MTDFSIDFDTTFAALTGCGKPFPWQRRLYNLILAGEWPESLDIPTGLGKTSVMPIWLLALASGASGVPRRLVYVVNRRTIVDQATDEARKLFFRLLGEPLAEGDPPFDIDDEKRAMLDRVVAALKVRAGDGKDFMSISTLRGQLADSGQWMCNAARPAIIVGTVDMIGSRLLFGAYRSSWKQCAMQAGLVGRDALIVHDEAHLTQPFQRLLEYVRGLQAGDTSTERSLRVLAMSATSSVKANADSVKPAAIILDAADHAEPMVRRRLHAAKRLQLHPTEKRGHIKLLAALAAAHETGTNRVIVYVRTPDDAAKVASELTGKMHGIGRERVALLTGTIRGYERDRLADGPVLQVLTDREAAIERTHYLVSTSAGEVGADFDADHLVCDATSLDSLVQRLGRVNRRGDAEQPARVDLVHESTQPKSLKPGSFDAAVVRTLELLNALPMDDDGRHDVSPAALRKFVDGLQAKDRKDASSPVPIWSAPHEAVLDAWSLTSIRDSWPLAHELTPYLHGVEDDARPETTIAWRAELDELQLSRQADDREYKTLEAWLDELYKSHRLRTHETLRITNTKDLVTLLTQARQTLVEAGDDARARPGVFVTIRGKDTRICRLLEMAVDEVQEAVTGAIVILPASFGGLSDKGMLDPKPDSGPPSRLDVADHEDYQGQSPRSRVLLSRDDDDQWIARTLSSTRGAVGKFSDLESARDQLINTMEAERTDGLRLRKTKQWVLDADVNGEPSRLLLLVGPREKRGTHASNGVPLADHVGDVVFNANRSAEALGLDPAMRAVYQVAAELHDTGKAQEIWQKAVYNSKPAERWGKPGRRGMNGKQLDGYRHEFRSMIDTLRDLRFEALDGSQRELVLHLIGSHHGYARPHFTNKALNHLANGGDSIDSRLSPAAIARRFDRLQRKHGRWGLAWLEAVFMSADIAASADALVPEDE